MKFILAKKVNMTQVFGEDGRVQAATVLSAGPVTITQIKTAEKDGYSAVQVGYGQRKEKNINKAQRTKGNFAFLKEIRGTGELEDFTVGDKVEVSALSKGKGFQGVVKRHGFHGGPRSHGQKHSEREHGSIGGGGRAGGRVIKGMRMGGRMGKERVTVKNLMVLAVDAQKSELVVSGAVPGRRGTLVEIRG